LSRPGRPCRFVGSKVSPLAAEAASESMALAARLKPCPDEAGLTADPTLGMTKLVRAHRGRKMRYVANEGSVA
jgi:hypothetical protein